MIGGKKDEIAQKSTRFFEMRSVAVIIKIAGDFITSTPPFLFFFLCQSLAWSERNFDWTSAPLRTFRVQVNNDVYECL